MRVPIRAQATVLDLVRLRRQLQARAGLAGYLWEVQGGRFE